MERRVPVPAAGVHPRAAATGRGAAVRVARVHPHSGGGGARGVLRRRVLRQSHLLAQLAHPADGGVVPATVRAPRARPRRPGDRRLGRAGVHAAQQPGRGRGVPALLRQRPRLRARTLVGGVHRPDPVDRRIPAAGDRPDPGVPRLRARLPAPAVPDRPCRAAGEDGARAAGPARGAGRTGAAQGIRRRTPRTRPRRPYPRVPGGGRAGQGTVSGRAGAAMSRLAVVSGGLREPSSTRLLADRLDQAVQHELSRAGAEVTSSVIELRRLGRPIMDAMLTGFPTSELEEAFETVAAADALIAVTPAFNASFSGLFKCFFDVLPEESLADMPVLIAATGGTERHSLVLEHALRPMFSYLHAVVSPTGVYAATEDFGARSASGGLAERIGRAAADFTRLLRSCGTRTRRDAFAEQLAEMEQLLGGTAPGRNAR